MPKLWRYNLHYHDYLWELPFESAQKLVRDWMEHYPMAKNRDGWEPYPISLRIINWCAYFWGNQRARTEADPAFTRQLWTSLAVQAEYLRKHLETHLLGNHYLENGVALSLAGACFSGSAAKTWLNQGLDILNEQLPEQMLEDGCHFERSPMYHSRVVWCLLALLNTQSAELREVVREPARQALAALQRFTHPDGQIALFNDSAFGIYQAPGELSAWGQRMGMAIPAATGAWELPAAGYYGGGNAEGNYVICDAGAVGPDYIPGHAHGDIFSYELSYRGQRIITDTGVMDYERSATRSWSRSTRAHNTVTVNGQDQCEFWGAFRVGHRGYPREVRWQPAASGFELAGWHDGFARQPGRPIHRRQLTWDGATLSVSDHVKSSQSVEAVSRVQLHPACSVDRVEATAAWVATPIGQVTIQFSGTGQLRVETGDYFPQFGVKASRPVLAWVESGVDLKFGYRISKVGNG